MLLALFNNLNNALLLYNYIVMVKLSIKTLSTLKDLFLHYPLKSDNDISKMANLSQPTVSKYRKIYDEQIDQAFISQTAGLFIKAFGSAEQYWQAQIQELEYLKTKKKTIFKKNQDGSSRPEEVDLEPMDILAICKQQAELQAKILFLASQGRVREVIKVMRSGKLPVLEAQ